MHRLFLISTLFLTLLLSGCGGSDSETISGTLPGGGTGDTGGGTPVETPTDESVPVSSVYLQVTPATMGTNQSAVVATTLYNASGQLIGGEKEVTFTLDNPALGSIVSPSTISDGVGSHIYNARGTQGTVVITATVDGKSDTQTIQISNQVAAAEIIMAANPASVSTGGTAVVSATVLDESGQPMPDGTLVNFEVDDPTLGSVVASSTTASGVAQATFSANAASGIATITATAGSAVQSLNLDVVGSSVATGSIEFFSATPQVIVIQGAGGDETSEVKFLVKDANGNPIASSETVRLELSGPNGGEYLGSTAGVTALDVGTVNGFASVILHSGAIPGTVTITASVDGTNLSTSSGVISIGGGVPSAGHFSLSTSRFNLEGFRVDGITADITARIADRYGNYNVLEGTSVSYYSECGAIDRAVALSNQGEGTVVFRTQTPAPQDVTVDPLETCGTRCQEENAFIADFEGTFGVTITGGASQPNPRDGLCTLIAVVEGEEEFTDNDASGGYDSGEPFDDTYDDIHMDMDDDEYDLTAYTTGVPYDAAFEDLVVDRDEDAVFDGMNGAWDANKRIGKTINLLYTGEPTLTLSNWTFAVPDGGSQTIYFAVHDFNYNRPIGGSDVSVAIDGSAALSGVLKWQFYDSNAIGTPILSVTVSDKTLEDEEPAEVVTLKFTINWPAETETITKEISITGIVD